MIVIEMNPRVSRSSALASKATGFPIAKIAAKLAVGYTLDEIPNDITRETPASFEPTIDYCVVKVPRFTFEKFPEADATLTTQMKSVGEAMAIGRTFKEALQKALRSLEIKRFGLCGDGNEKRGSMPKRCGCKLSDPECRADLLSRPRLPGRHVDRGDLRADEDRSVVPAQHRGRSWKSNGQLGVLSDFRSAASEEARLFRSPARPFVRRERSKKSGRRRKAAGGHPHLPPGRYLRRGVRGLHALLLLDLRRRERDAPHQ